MRTLPLVLAEIRYRWSNVAISIIALSSAGCLVVLGPAVIDRYAAATSQQLDSMASQAQWRLDQLRAETDQELSRMQSKSEADLVDLDKRTKRIMRDLGFNLRIVHENTDLELLYTDFVSFPMPESYVNVLAESPQLTKVAHLVATFQQMIEWGDSTRLVVGFSSEVPQTHVEKKPPMGFQIEPGTVYLGHLAAQGLAVGDAIDVRGNSFSVARILPPEGNRDRDVMIGMHLSDAQRVFDMEGMITEIIALGCKCETVERVEEIQAQLELVLPQTQVVELRTQAIARDDQRNLIKSYYQEAMEDYRVGRAAIVQAETTRHEELKAEVRRHRTEVLGWITSAVRLLVPLFCVTAAIWIACLAWSNARSRRYEIGVLRAIGKPAGQVAALFLTKAVLIGLAGGLIGAIAGLALDRAVAAAWFSGPAGILPPRWDLAAAVVLGGPCIALLATCPPTLRALARDPAGILVEP